MNSSDEIAPAPGRRRFRLAGAFTVGDVAPHDDPPALLGCDAGFRGARSLSGLDAPSFMRRRL